MIPFYEIIKSIYEEKSKFHGNKIKKVGMQQYGISNFGGFYKGL